MTVMTPYGIIGWERAKRHCKDRPYRVKSVRRSAYDISILVPRSFAAFSVSCTPDSAHITPAGWLPWVWDGITPLTIRTA